MLHEDRVRALSFGEDAERYDRSRPTYPELLVDRLTTPRPTTVLDVGCGTGLAARLFVERGVTVLGIEPDPRMAALARRHGIAVEEATFETWDARNRQFDLLISGQAWHWVEPMAGIRKAAEVIGPGGNIGLFWNMGRMAEHLRSRFESIYAERAPGLERYSVLLGQGETASAQSAATSLSSSGWEAIEVESFPFEVMYRTDEWLDHLQTHSDHRGLPPERLRLLLDAIGSEIDGLGGSFPMRYETALASLFHANRPERVSSWSGVVRPLTISSRMRATGARARRVRTSGWW